MNIFYLKNSQKVEFAKMATVLNLYFDCWIERKCFDVEGYREYEVTDLKSSAIYVYSYYSKGEL